LDLVIYYEVMCPACARFFLESLKPVLEDEHLKRSIALQFFPTGNMEDHSSSHISQGYLFFHPEKHYKPWIFFCEHGESECMGNQIHACVMHILESPDQYMPFIYCMFEMVDEFPEQSSYKCMQKLNISMDSVKDCVFGVRENAEEHWMLKQDNLLDPPMDQVPWVTINQKHVPQKDIGNLKNLICFHLEEHNERPPPCEGEHYEHEPVHIEPDITFDMHHRITP